MPINPNILLGFSAPDVSKTFTSFENALIGAQNRDIKEQALAQAREQQPLRNRLLEAQSGLLEAQAQTAEAGVPSEQAQATARQVEIIQSLSIGAQQIIPDLQAGRTDQVLSKLQRRRSDLIRAEKPTNETDEAIQLAQNNPGELLTRSQQAVDLANQLKSSAKGVQFGGQQTFKDTKGNLFFGTTQRDTQSGSVNTVLAPIGDAPTQPVGQVSLVGSAGLTAAEQVRQKVAIQEQVGDVKVMQEVEKAGRSEAAKLKTQFKLKPQVESAVSQALAVVKADSSLKEETRSNERAFNVYNTAMTGLVDALGGTITGPILGLIPAVTENQQIADGAVAAMAPVLKQVFRAAGEGIFTDKDQELLLDMAPKRTDGPKARLSKLSNIDAIVRAKLGITGQSSQNAVPATQPQVIRFDDQGNIIQ